MTEATKSSLTPSGLPSRSLAPAAASPVTLKGRVLLVDDEPALLAAFRRVLAAAGHDVQTAGNGKEAMVLLNSADFDVIVADLVMPGVDGLQLLRTVRAHDLDVPVVMMTGSPTLETAIQALEYGALRYLTKPVDLDALKQVVAQAVRLHRLAKLKRQALELLGSDAKQLGDRASLEASFARALSTIWMAFQPIVCWSEKRIFGYEALVRANEPTLPHPGALFDAAERLAQLPVLGRAIRASVASTVAPSAIDGHTFVNLHPLDLMDDSLFAPESPLSSIASRVVLEITERASLDHVKDVRTRIANLRQMGFRVAVDDLGAGYAGLASFAQLEPEVVKLDMALVRDIDKNATKKKLAESMVTLCRDLGMLVIAEGIETPAERDTLISLGCDHLQGYLFAKPGKPFPNVVF